tara:strand:+ start:663 stop:1370 length:708 start_codon:yes stop_codon:yes gene_type:complete
VSSVSIVIPVKDCELTIEKSISSVINQTYQDFEVVLVDNGCSDKTIELARDIGKDKIKVFECNTPGIVPALNTGLQNSKCDIIARQDGDDVWYPTKLEKQINLLNNNPNISICGTQIRLVSKDNEVVDDAFRYPTEDHSIKSWLLTGRNAIAHPSAIFRKNILLRVGGYDDSYPVAEDHHLWLRCIKWFNFCNLSEVLVDYTSSHNTKYDPKFPLMASESQYKLLNYSGFIRHAN